MTPEQAAKLREPFKPEQIGKLPKAGTTLSYVGHAAVTARLLEVDAEWTWEPVAWAANGTPLWASDGGDAVMWIKLTVAGVTRFGVGICKSNAFELEKQLISDAIRNAAMRFGVAIDLWSKEDLGASENAETETDVGTREPSPAPKRADPPSATTPEPVSATPDEWLAPPAELHTAQALVRSLVSRGVSVADVRTREKLPKIDKNCPLDQFRLWQRILADLDTANPVVAPAVSA